MLMQICDNFVQSMTCYAADFAEQRSTLLDDSDLAKQYETKNAQAAATVSDSKKEAKKMLKVKKSAFGLKRSHKEAFK